MNRLIAVVALSVGIAACGSNATAPTGGPTATATRIINVSGNGAFGNVNVGSTADHTITISNTGSGTLTFTGINAVGGTGTAGYTASPTTGTIAPGGTANVNLHFAPVLGQFYSMVMTIVGDQTTGNAAINISGTGIITAPIFVQSGTGDNVFTIPSYVTKVRIDANYGGSCQNFIVNINASPFGLVNVIIGTCSVADTKSPFSGTYAVSGGAQLSIVSSTGVNWTVTELR